MGKEATNSEWTIAGSVFTCFGSLLLFQSITHLTLIPVGSFELEIWLSLILCVAGAVCFLVYLLK